MALWNLCPSVAEDRVGARVPSSIQNMNANSHSLFSNVHPNLAPYAYLKLHR